MRRAGLGIKEERGRRRESGTGPGEGGEAEDGVRGIEDRGSRMENGGRRTESAEEYAVEVKGERMKDW